MVHLGTWPDGIYVWHAGADDAGHTKTVVSTNPMNQATICPNNRGSGYSILFCLGPSRYTEHSVKNSPWREGRGDVVVVQ